MTGNDATAAHRLAERWQMALGVACGVWRPDLRVDVAPETPWWSDLRGNLAWVLPIRVRLTSHESEAVVRVRVPWFCDEVAWATSPPPLRLGRHTGLYVGRPFVSLTQAAPRPGSHLVARPGLQTVRAWSVPESARWCR